jgi:cell division protein FtsN
MVDLKESFHESVIIKRSKRRLIGAITILIILFSLSLVFVKNTGQTDVKKEIKVSFLKMGPASFNNKKTIEKIEVVKLSTIEFEKKTNAVKKVDTSGKIFTVQIGIFSDKNKTQQLSRQINNMGFKTQMKKITLSGQEKIKLTTEFFNSEKDAQQALRKLKNSNFPGLIKRQ